MSSTNTAPILGTATVTSAAGVSTTAGTAIEGLSACESVVLLAAITSVAGGTLDVYVQTRHGATWYDYAHFPQMAAGGATVNYRLQCTRGEGNAAPIVIGTAAVPGLAANACVGGDFGDALRLVVVAGAGAAAGGVETCIVSGTFPVS